MNSTHIKPCVWENEVCTQTEMAALLIKHGIGDNLHVQQWGIEEGHQGAVIHWNDIAAITKLRKL